MFSRWFSIVFTLSLRERAMVPGSRAEQLKNMYLPVEPTPAAFAKPPLCKSYGEASRWYAPQPKKTAHSAVATIKLVGRAVLYTPFVVLRRARSGDAYLNIWHQTI